MENNIEIIYEINENIIDSIYFISSKSEYINLSKNNIKKYINDKFHNVIIIKDRGETVGFLIYFLSPPEIDIIFIAVHPNCKGYGTELLTYLFNDALNNKVNSIKLDLHQNNTAAKKFYEKNGFKEIAIRKKYYNNKFDAIIMEKQFCIV